MVQGLFLNLRNFRMLSLLSKGFSHGLDAEMNNL